MSFSPPIPTASNGSTTLASTFTLTAANGIFQATGLFVNVPAAGTYLLIADVRCTLQTSAGSNGYVGLEFFNITNSVVVTSSLRFGTFCGQNGVPSISTTAIQVAATFDGPKQIGLYASRNNATTYTFSSVDQDQTVLAYVKLS